MVRSLRSLYFLRPQLMLNVMPSIALPGYQWNPAWAPDGSVIAFRQSCGLSSHLYTVRADGTGLRLRPPDPAWGGAVGPTWIRRR